MVCYYSASQSSISNTWKWAISGSKVTRETEMVKPYWDKDEGKYCVKAFGEVHKFDDLDGANCYANEVNDFWMKEYDYLEDL